MLQTDNTVFSLRSSCQPDWRQPGVYVNYAAVAKSVLIVNAENFPRCCCCWLAMTWYLGIPLLLGGLLYSGLSKFQILLLGRPHWFTIRNHRHIHFPRKANCL